MASAFSCTDSVMTHPVEACAFRPPLFQQACIDRTNYHVVRALACALSNRRCRGLSLPLFEDQP